MSDQPGSNKSRTLQYRNELLLFIHAAGFITAAGRAEVAGLTAEERRVRDVGDIMGLQPWTLAVRNEQNLDLSGAQDQVQREAERAGNDWYASIQKRKAHDMRDSYVTMPMHVFLGVLGRLHPELLDRNAHSFSLANSAASGG